MPSAEAALRTIARRVQVDSERSIVVDGVVRGLAPRAFSPHDVAAQTRHLGVWLYTAVYVTGNPEGASPALDAAATRPIAPATIEAVRRANPTRTYWSPQWIVESIGTDGSVTARRRLSRRTFRAGGFVAYDRPGASVDVGARIAVLWTKESTVSQAGYYHCFGETPPDSWESSLVGRFYFHVDEKTAPAVVGVVAGVLNRFCVPFQMKCNLRLDRLARTDGVVLYVASRRCAAVTRMLGDRAAELRDLVTDPVPLFALRLDRGVAYADDPANGESFGQDRCAVIARGLVQAWLAGRTDSDARFETIREEWLRAGLSMDHPYLRPRVANPPEFATAVVPAADVLPSSTTTVAHAV